MQQLTDLTALLSHFDPPYRDAVARAYLETNAAGVLLYAVDPPEEGPRGHEAALYGPDMPTKSPEEAAPYERPPAAEDGPPRRLTPVAYYAKPTLAAPAGA